MASSVLFEWRHDLRVSLMQAMGGDHSIVAAARVSTDVHESVRAWGADPAESEGLINFLMKNRHMSPFEHVVFTVRVEAPIFVFREWHRHRTQSYNEMSGRYTQLLPHFYIPAEDRPLQQVGRAGAYSFEPGTPQQYVQMEQTFRHVCSQAWLGYQGLLDAGIAKEVASRLLPTTTYSQMYATMNLRNAFQFLSLRTQHEDALFPSYPQFEIARAADQVEEHVKFIAPMAYAAWLDNKRV